MKTKKLTLKELLKAIDEHNEANKVESQFSDKNPLWCVVVFKNESWPHRNRNYTLKERSYKFRSDNKRFLPKMCGTSIFAECLDEWEDQCIRLDFYLHDWKVDYCYIEEAK